MARGARPRQATPSPMTPGPMRTQCDQPKAERRSASPGVHAGAPGGPIVPGKYPGTASARGKVARAGGQTTRGAPCCPDVTVCGRPIGTGAAPWGARGLAAGRRRSPRGDDGRRTEGRPHGRRRAAAGPARSPAGRLAGPLAAQLAGAHQADRGAGGAGGRVPGAGQLQHGRPDRQRPGVRPGRDDRRVRAPGDRAGRTSCRPSATCPPATSPAGRPASNAAKIARDHRGTTRSSEDPTKKQPVPAPSLANPMLAQRRNVDAALASYRAAERDLGDVGPQARARIDTARAQLDGLAQLRSAVLKKQLTEGAITGQYTDVITALSEVDREIGQRSGNRELSQSVAGLTALADLKETLSQERALLYSVAAVNRFQFGQFQDLSASHGPAAGGAAAVPHRRHRGPAQPVRPAGQRPGRARGEAARGQRDRRPEPGRPRAGRAAVVLGSHHLHARRCARSRSRCSTRSSPRRGSCARTRSGRPSPPA